MLKSWIPDWKSAWSGGLFLLLTALSLVGGCDHAGTDHFPDLPDFADIGEEAVLSPEEQAQRRKVLEEIAAEPYPAYRINAGDVFMFRVYNNPDLAVDETLVTPDGLFSVGLVGTVKISGLSIAAAEKKIEGRLKEYIRNPKVSLIPRAINSQMATLGGKVFKSGRFPVNANLRLADLIALGQGMPNAMSDERQVELSDLSTSIFVRNGKILPIDFNLAVKGDKLHNVRVRGGDYVHIATRADQQISVIGEVKEPKYVTWYRNIGVTEAISCCYGLKDEHANNVVVIRGGLGDPTVYRANLTDILTGKRVNPGLLPGDILYIPKDDISEYNVFVRKLMPTGQLINMLITPGAFIAGGNVL